MSNNVAQHDVLSIVFESTHMLVAYLDKDLRFVKVNKAYAMADDKEPGEFIGKRHFDLYPNEKNERIFRRAIESGEPHFSYAQPFEYEDHPERGVTHWDWSLIPSKNECGEVTGAVLQLVDVTERIEAEEKLRIEQDFGDAVLAAANALVVVLDSNGRIKRFNTACEKITGYSFDEVHNRYVWDFLLTEEEVEPVKQVFQNLADTALPNQFTNCWVGKDGAKRIIDWHNSTMLDDDGKVRFVLSVGVDVTEKQQVIEKLERSEEILKRAQALGHTGAWDWKIRDNNLQWSEEVFRIFGVKPDEFGATYEHFLEFVHEEDRLSVQAAVDESLADPDASYQIDHRIVRSDGEIRYVKETGRVYFDKDGKPFNMVGIIQDITDTYQIMEKLRFQAQLIDQIKGSVISTDLDGIVTTWNRGAESLFGFTAEEAIGQPVCFVYPPDQHSQLAENVIGKLKEEGTLETEVILWKKNGERFNGHLSLSLQYNARQQPIGMIGHTIDDSDRVRMEKELQKSNQFNETVVSSLPIGVAMYDESGQCVMANNCVAKNVGATREQLLAQNFHDIASWKGSGMYDAAIKAFETNSMQRVQSEHMTSFGNEVAFDAWFQSILIGEKKHLLVMLKDISERKRDEKKIRNQAQIIDQIHDSVITTDLDGYIASWNKGAERIFGYTEEEAVDKHISLIYPESELATLQNEVISSLVENGWHETESLMRRKNGEIFTGHLSLSFLTDDQGERIRMIGYTMDVSDRIQAEQDLIRKEQTLSEAQAIAHVGNWEWNIEDGTIEWSDEIFRIFGYEPGSFDPTYDTFLRSIHEEDRESVERAINASLADPVKNYQVQHRVVTPANVIRTVQEDGRIFLDDSGKPARMVGTVKDITELKQANAELEKSRTRFQTMFESISDAVILTNTDRKMEIVNHGMLELFGYTEDELLGKGTSMLYPKRSDYSKVGQEHFSADAPAIGHDIYEMQYRRKDGTVFWGETLASKVVSSNGEINAFVGIIRDITDRKNTELELEKYRERLEELVDERTQELRTAQDALVRRERLATLGQLTATVSHELRNPLGAMQPALFIVRKNADPQNEKLQKALARIDRSIARCDHIIDELLDFTRNATLNLHAVVLDNWLQTVCAEQETPSGISLKQELGLNDIEIMIDSSRLQRAVINVIENGLQSMLDETGSRVNVERPELKVFTRDRDENVEIGIQDRGAGIPADVLPHIFEALYSTKGFGVGLGMPTVKNIIEQHGGGIQIDSHPGEGTTVILRLPKIPVIKPGIEGGPH